MPCQACVEGRMSVGLGRSILEDTGAVGGKEMGTEY